MTPPRHKTHDYHTPSDDFVKCDWQKLRKRRSPFVPEITKDCGFRMDHKEKPATIYFLFCRFVDEKIEQSGKIDII